MYRINSRQLNGQPSYVFKSSMEMARLAQSMDRDGNGQMKDEYAHVDATHQRYRGLKSVTLRAYHEISRKLVCLAILDIGSENIVNLTIFWTLMNEMLQELSGNSEYTFNPKELMNTTPIGVAFTMYLIWLVPIEQSHASFIFRVIQSTLSILKS